MPNPMITGREHRQQRRRRELAQRRGGADVDDRAVVGLLGVVHDPGLLTELPADLLHDHTRGAADGADGERREEERDRAADEQTDEGLRIGDVDRDDASNTVRPLSSSASTPSSPSFSPAIVSTNEANRATAAMTAEPMAKPLVTALVVLPTASRLTMMRSGSP